MITWLFMLNINSLAKIFDIPYISYKIIAYTENIENNINIALPLLKRLVFLSVFIYALRRKTTKLKKAQGTDWLYFNAYYLSIVEFLAFSPLGILASRGTACLYFTFIPLFSISLSRERKNGVRFLILCFALYGAIDNLVTVLFESAGGTYIPYHFGF